MEVLISTSRSVTQDRLWAMQQQLKYRKHIERVGAIVSDKRHPHLDVEKHMQSVEHTLKKAKSAAKLFKVREEEHIRKKENMTLLKRIWHLEPCVDTSSPEFQNMGRRKHKVEDVKQENKGIVRKIKENDFKDYRKKMQSEIEKYLQLRAGLRKVEVKKIEVKKLEVKKDEVKKDEVKKLEVKNNSGDSERKRRPRLREGESKEKVKVENPQLKVEKQEKQHNASSLRTIPQNVSSNSQANQLSPIQPKTHPTHPLPTH